MDFYKACAVSAWCIAAAAWCIAGAVLAAIALLWINDARGEEEPWGYSYTPVIITWYGEDVPKFKHELKPFTVKGYAVYKPEQLQACEDKSREVRQALTTTDKQFGSIVLCVRRPIEEPVEQTDEQKSESES